MKKNKFILVVLLLIFALMIVAMPAVSAGPSPSISLDVSFTGPDRSPDEYGVYGGGGAGYGMYCLSATITISGLAPPKMDPERSSKEGWRSGGFEVLFFSGPNVDDPDLEGYRVPLETVEKDSDGDGGTYTYKRCRIPQETGQWKIVVTAWGPYSYKVETTRISETAGPYEVVLISPPYPVVVVLTPEQQWEWFESCVNRNPNCQMISKEDYLKKWMDAGSPIGWDYEYTGCPGADFPQDGEFGTICRREEVVCCPPDEISCLMFLRNYQLCMYDPEIEACREYHSFILRNFCMGGGGAEPKKDSDGDGVPDDVDACHGTPAGVAVDDKGCPIGMQLSLSTDKETYSPGETVIIRGSVWDAKGGLDGATVVVDVDGTKLTATAYSTEKYMGKYECEFPLPSGITQGEYTVTATASYPGYPDKSKSTSFTVGGEIKVTLDTDKEYYMVGDEAKIYGYVKVGNQPIGEAEVEITFSYPEKKTWKKEVQTNSDGYYECSIYITEESWFQTEPLFINLSTDKNPEYERGEPVTISGEIVPNTLSIKVKASKTGFQTAVNQKQVGVGVEEKPPELKQVFLTISTPWGIKLPPLRITPSAGKFSITPFAGYALGEYSIEASTKYKGINILNSAKFEVWESAPATQEQIDEVLRLYKWVIPEGFIRSDKGYSSAWCPLMDIKEGEMGFWNNLCYGSNGFHCAGYRDKVLYFLDKLRFSQDPKKRALLRGLDYGPVQRGYGCKSLFGRVVAGSSEHHVVILYHTGTIEPYRADDVWVLDPWLYQRPEVFKIKEFKTQCPEWSQGEVTTCLPDREYRDGGLAYSYPLMGSPVYLNFECKEWSTKRPESPFLGLEKYVVAVACPVNVLITDSEERRLGRLENGSFVFEIPNSQLIILSDDDATPIWFFALPEGVYQTSIKGYKSGPFNLLTRGKDWPVRDYGGQVINKGDEATITLDSSDPSSPLNLPNGEQVYPHQLAGVPATAQVERLYPIHILLFATGGVAGLAFFALLIFLLVTRRRSAPAAPPVPPPARPVRPRGRPEELVSRRLPARPEGPPETLD